MRIERSETVTTLIRLKKVSVFRKSERSDEADLRQMKRRGDNT